MTSVPGPREGSATLTPSAEPLTGRSALHACTAVYDRVEQLRAVQASLLIGETVYAVYDGLGLDVGLLGLTNLRIVLQDESARIGTVSLLSVPYSRVQSVGLVSASSSPSSFAGSDTVQVRTTAAPFEVRLRDHGKAQHAHDVILHFLTR